MNEKKEYMLPLDPFELGYLWGALELYMKKSGSIGGNPAVDEKCLKPIADRLISLIPISEDRSQYNEFISSFKKQLEEIKSNK